MSGRVRPESRIGMEPPGRWCAKVRLGGDRYKGRPFCHCLLAKTPQTHSLPPPSLPLPPPLGSSLRLPGARQGGPALPLPNPPSSPPPVGFVTRRPRLHSPLHAPAPAQAPPRLSKHYFAPLPLPLLPPTLRPQPLRPTLLFHLPNSIWACRQTHGGGE